MITSENSGGNGGVDTCVETGAKTAHDMLPAIEEAQASEDLLDCICIYRRDDATRI